MNINVKAEMNDDQTAIWVKGVQLSRAVYDDDQESPTCEGCMFGEKGTTCKGVCCTKDKRKDNMSITWRAV